MCLQLVSRVENPSHVPAPGLPPQPFINSHVCYPDRADTLPLLTYLTVLDKHMRISFFFILLMIMVNALPRCR